MRTVVEARETASMSAKPFVRKRYWNEPTMSWWERSYLFEIVRGLSITGGVFMKNMWRWITLRNWASRYCHLADSSGKMSYVPRGG